MVDLESIFKESEVQESMGEEECCADDGEVEEFTEDKATEVDVVPGDDIIRHRHNTKS